MNLDLWTCWLCTKLIIHNLWVSTGKPEAASKGIRDRWAVSFYSEISASFPGPSQHIIPAPRMTSSVSSSFSHSHSFTYSFLIPPYLLFKGCVLDTVLHENYAAQGVLIWVRFLCQLKNSKAGEMPSTAREESQTSRTAANRVNCWRELFRGWGETHMQ